MMMRGPGSLFRFLLIGGSIGLMGGRVVFAGACDEQPPVAQLHDVAKQRTSRQLVSRYKESVDSIRTIKAEMRVVTGRRFPESLEGLKRDGTGRVIVYEAKREWEAATQRYRLERSALTKADGVAAYTPLVAASDGIRYRGYNPDPNPGVGELEAEDSTDEGKLQGDGWDYWWIPELLGYHFAPGPDRALWEVLDGAKVIELEGTPPHLVVLETNYKFFGENNETHLLAWIDTSHGCLPSRVETVRRWSGTLAERFEVEEFHEASPGVWVPVQGSIHRYAIDLILPEGLTKKDVSRLSSDELRALGTLSAAKPLGGEGGFFPDKLIVDKDRLRVNEAIPRDRFLLKFPTGMRVLDTKEGARN